MKLIYFFIILLFFIAVFVLLLKKFNVLKLENGKIPKEFLPIIYILIFLSITMASMLLYNLFISGAHYNF